MVSIGLIANPASGKDIRRLVSYATTIGNAEKANILMRIVLAAQQLGVRQFYLMPDGSNIVDYVIGELKNRNTLPPVMEKLPITLHFNQDDTETAATMMAKKGVGCIVVLGGDGTSRVAAGCIGETPLLPVSTGTNNVYPGFYEGTAVGMAAAIAADPRYSDRCCIRDKRIEIYRNGVLEEIALIDAVITSDTCVGARAIWDIDKISHIVVSRASPASIGFSAVAGSITTVMDTDDYGVAVQLGGDDRVLAPIAAGVLTEVPIAAHRKLCMNEVYTVQIGESGMVAVDGERQMRVRAGDVLTFQIRRNGPRRVLVQQAIELARDEGMFRRRGRTESRT